MKKYNYIDLFSGGGGLALGLEQANFNGICFVDNDKTSCQTLKYNRPDWNVIQKDISTIESINEFLKEQSQVDLITFGVPCQSFSYAGKRLGLEDIRGTLFYDAARILNEILPKVFLLENVKGLKSHDSGRTLKTMIDVFSDIGYTVQYEILNALDYNVAQKRERLIMIGIRNDLDHSIYNFPQKCNKKLILKDVLQNVPISGGVGYSENKRKILSLVPPGGCWRDLPEDIAKEYMGSSYFSSGGRTGIARRLSWEEPCLTILCSPSQKQTERCHPDEVRPFTIRESARIQGFPDNYEFIGSISNQYKQIGNAVPPPMAYYIGLSIYNFLSKYS